MNASRAVRTLLAIFVTTVVAVWSTGTPALAGPYVTAFHGIDYGMADSGTDLDMWACDGENDFHTMWAEVQTTHVENRIVFDAIADGVCVYRHLSQAADGYITYIRACEETEGCSAWKHVL
ncbi:MAG TPA: hypothetical protein VFC19_15100 [Candidatus Limnocylindrales bacterium]|nr:hypothetical protein [Candidatus Limnocylindrales bacterium]